MTRRLHAITAGAMLLAALAAFATPAKADHCDDLAKQLSQQIDHLKVGATRGGIIYLQHPAASSTSLGCASRNKQAEFYAATRQKKPSDEFVSYVASAAAAIFTIPKTDTLRGAKRCLSRIGLIRGSNIATRYRKLDITCSRSTNGTNITFSREKE